MRIYLLIAAIAGGVTWLVTPLIRHVAIHIGAVGEVRARDVHTIPTPRMGGLGMLIGFAFAMIYSSRIAFTTGLFENNNQEWVILAGAVLICLLGMADDLWDLDWMLKMAGQLLISVFVAWGGLQIISLPLGSLITASPSISVTITAILIVASINAVNFVDGLDGLAAGIVGIAGLSFFAYSYFLARDASPDNYAAVSSVVVAALVGACLGFLPHNFHPARIFMGDSGALMLGVVISGAGIMVTGQIDPANTSVGHDLPAYMPILVPAAVVLLPLIDLVWAVVRRLARGQSPFHADAGHLHHRLLRRGHSHAGAVLVLYMWAAIASVGAVSLVIWPPAVVVPAVVLAILVGLLLTRRQLETGRAGARAGDVSTRIPDANAVGDN